MTNLVNSFVIVLMTLIAAGQANAHTDQASQKCLQAAKNSDNDGPCKGIIISLLSLDGVGVWTSSESFNSAGYLSLGLFFNPLLTPQTSYYGKVPQATVVGADCGYIHLGSEHGKYCEIAIDKYAVIGHFYFGVGKTNLRSEEFNSFSLRMQAFFLTFRIHAGMRNDGDGHFFAFGVGTGIPALISAW